jgi:RNA polymerase sigma-70 factor (ECF subfamily)
MPMRNREAEVVRELQPSSVVDERASEAVDHNAKLFLGSLFKKYRGSLFRYLRGLVPSADDAAELVQESYARLLRQSSVSQLEVVARTYLFQTATNLARDHFRRRLSRSLDSHCDIDDVAIADRARNPEEDLAWHQTIAVIKDGIKHLPPTTRKIFLLSRFRNKSYPEIAAMLGVSTRTVERKMSEAMAALGERFTEAL